MSKESLEKLKMYNLQQPARLERDLRQKRQELCNMQFGVYSRMLHSEVVTERESGIEGLSFLKGGRVVEVLAKHLTDECDDRLREKILDVIEQNIVLPYAYSSFTKMRSEETAPVSALATYALELANNYTHTLAAA